MSKLSELRNGRITSSEIYNLCSNGKVKGTFGKPFYTYVDEVNYERMLGRSLTTEMNTKPTTWGECLELYVNSKPEILGLEYQYCSQNTLIHPEIDFWAATPDNRKFGDGDTIVDTKNPYTLKSFCTLVKPLYDGLTGMDAMNKIRETHVDGEKFYQQLVSGSCVTNSRWAELIIFMPYRSQLRDIQLMIYNMKEDEQRPYYWIWMSAEQDLPYLNDNGKYQNKNVIRFEPPEADKAFLTSRVLAAGALLQQR